MARQEIHEGIYLLSERESPSSLILLIENQLAQAVSVTIDFEGSQGVIVNNSSSHEHTARVPSKSTELLVKLTLEPDAKLETKFEVAFRAAEHRNTLSAQRTETDEVHRKIRHARSTFRRIKYNEFHPDCIPEELGHFLDPSFPPAEESLYLGSSKKLPVSIQWRRPKDFFKGKFDVFLDEIEPNDIRQGLLGDCWFMCALSSLAERPPLVRRLFPSPHVNAEGFYQVFFCKGGEWTRVTIDDYFPCFPKEGPIFSRSHGNELWVLLLEKAYAKLHGSYNMLRGGWAYEGMMDLTGCPTVIIDFQLAEGQAMIDTDQVWPLLVQADETGALISASTPGEDRWTEFGRPVTSGGLVNGHAYTIIQAKEVYGHRLLNIRNPWGRFEWQGDWSDSSPCWTEEIKEVLKPCLTANDGTFWMSYEDFIKNYVVVNICKTSNFHEARIRGKFERRNFEGQEWVISRWCYVFTTNKATDVYIGIHQEDERMYGADSRRSYIDLGIVVLCSTDGTFQIYKTKETERTRQAEVMIRAEPNKKYMIWPRTTGCTLSRPEHVSTENCTWYEDGELHPLFESTIKDLFRKANVVIGEDLTYLEFATLMNEAGVQIDKAQFEQLLGTFPSHGDGLTIEGLIEYIRDQCSQQDEAAIRRWFEAWGYDQDLYSIRSRSYVLTLHSEHKLDVEMHKVHDLFINEIVHCMLLQKLGVKKGTSEGVELFCYLEKASNSFTYGVFNSNAFPVEVSYDCSNSEGLLFSSRTQVVTASIGPGEWKCLVHTQLKSGLTVCRLRPVFKVTRITV